MTNPYSFPGIVSSTAPDSAKIISCVCAHFQITETELKEKTRRAPVVLARHSAMFIMHNIKGMPYKQIGRIMGAKNHEFNHTSVLHGCNRILDDLQMNEDFFNSMCRLVMGIGAGYVSALRSLVKHEEEVKEVKKERIVTVVKPFFSRVESTIL